MTAGKGILVAISINAIKQLCRSEFFTRLESPVQGRSLSIPSRKLSRVDTLVPRSGPGSLHPANLDCFQKKILNGEIISAA